MNDSARQYGLIDRLLHRLALGSKTVRRVSFQLERELFDKSTDPRRADRAVFVVGLARSGTTALLQALYRTGVFQSLTYRDMPFVLMPRVWQRMWQLSRKDEEAKERAHGDSILVDFDSPESFEEVFWQTFSEQPYVRESFLIPHEPSLQQLQLFRGYIAAIASAAPSGDARYLSKNNNNILRLPALRRALPDASLLLIYRDPLQTARSLLNQHQHFVTIQKADAFGLRYMTWLGHHEFGIGHKPFRFSESSRLAQSSPDQCDYWLTYWIEVYEHVLALTDTGYLLINYDKLCATPLEVMRDIGVAIQCDAAWPPIAATFKRAFTAQLPEFSRDVVDRARAVHEALNQRAL